MSSLVQRFQESSTGMQFYTVLHLWLVATLISIGFVQLLWNTTLPRIGPFQKITYGQALRLTLLVGILTSAPFALQIVWS